MHEHAGRVTAGGWARVVARVGRQGARYHQPGGAGLLLGDDADAAALRVVDDVSAAVPVDEAGRVRRLQDDARQVYVTPALDEELRVPEDLRFWYWNTDKTKCQMDSKINLTLGQLILRVF